jgi:LAO/AO transport system kinase
MDLSQPVLAGDRLALARLLTEVENDTQLGRTTLNSLFKHTGSAHLVGVTGAPGTGKSSLVNQLALYYRQPPDGAPPRRVAIVAVDPSSPFTGGAVLGDRIRMRELSGDTGVFIRSMATRGSLGGLALATEEVCDVVDAFGFDRIFIETVGVGQTELDIASTADSTLVVLVPESGDGIQAMKAGLMEVADLFVVNKADRPGADRVVREIGIALHLRAGRMLSGVPAHHGVDLSRPAAPAPANAPRPAAWEPPVLLTVAETGRGIAELAAALDRHAIWLERSGERSRRRRRRLAERVRQEVDRALRERVWTERGAEGILESEVEALEHGDASPWEVAARIVQRALDRPGPGPDAESEAGSRGRDSGMTGAGGATGAARDE